MEEERAGADELEDDLGGRVVDEQRRLNGRSVGPTGQVSGTGTHLEVTSDAAPEQTQEVIEESSEPEPEVMWL